MKISFVTLGCRLNFAETEELIEKFQKIGYQISFQKPQICVVRGCSVTKKAEKETKQKIREFKKNKIFVIAAGCLKNNFFCPEADLILPKNQEYLIFKKIKRFAHPLAKKVAPLLKIRTRSFIKIQDGCQNFCTYCLVPYLRGKEVSKSPEEIIKQIKEKEKFGYQEIVLAGVNIFQWREKGKDFIWLLKKILRETSIPRIRISSLWPDKINQQLFRLFKNLRFCRHLHLSFQSLSQSILKRMDRNYKIGEIKNKIKKIKEMFPDLTLTGDIIVGFPSESEKEFQETIKNLKEIGMIKIHIFRYSPREGTRAISFKNQVEERSKKKRAEILEKLSEELGKKWRKKFLGKTRKVLFEQKKGGFWHGLTDNYLKVFVENRRNLANQILPIKLVKLYKEGIKGKLIKKNSYWFKN